MLERGRIVEEGTAAVLLGLGQSLRRDLFARGALAGDALTRVRLTLADAPFAGRTGRGVTVAVLDSGVHGDHPHVGGVRGGMSLRRGRPTPTISSIASATEPRSPRRSAKRVPRVDLIAARIFDRQLATNVDVLVRAIRWAADEGAQLINLSLGTDESRARREAGAGRRLRRRARRAGRLGARVEWRGVAAGQSRRCRRRGGGRRRWIATRSTSTARRRALPRFTAAPFPRPIPNVPRERNLSGVSFAVANVTGFLARATEALGDPFRAAGLGG